MYSVTCVAHATHVHVNLSKLGIEFKNKKLQAFKFAQVRNYIRNAVRCAAEIKTMRVLFLFWNKNNTLTSRLAQVWKWFEILIHSLGIGIG